MRWISIDYPPPERLEVLIYIISSYGPQENRIVHAVRTKEDIYFAKNVTGDGYSSAISTKNNSIVYWMPLPLHPDLGRNYGNLD